MELLSKTAALENEISCGSPFADAFKLALQMRSISDINKIDDNHSVLKEHFLRIAPSAADLLCGLVRG